MSEANSVERTVGGPAPQRDRPTPRMRSMLSRAAHLPPFGSSLATEYVDGVCVQCEGRPVWRRTLDGMQKTVSFHWFIRCKRSSKAEVHRLMAAAENKSPNTERSGAERPAGAPSYALMGEKGNL